jgi:hypothetical protein
MISYHFYAVPNSDEPPEAQQFTYFNQADKFLEIVGYIETIRKMLSPKTGSNPPVSSRLAGSSFKLGGFGVAAVTLGKRRD